MFPEGSLSQVYWLVMLIAVMVFLKTVRSIVNNAQNTIFIDPLVLDLDGNGVQLAHFDQANVFFDIDHEGVEEQSSWVSPTDGLLAIDLNNNGKIDDVSELFSEYYQGAKGQDGDPVKPRT